MRQSEMLCYTKVHSHLGYQCACRAKLEFDKPMHWSSISVKQNKIVCVKAGEMKEHSDCRYL